MVTIIKQSQKKEKQKLNKEAMKKRKKPERKLTKNIVFGNEHHKDINTIKNIFKGIINKSANN